jgi:ribosomal protein S18 acetylase RimI-like enzyme
MTSSIRPADVKDIPILIDMVHELGISDGIQNIETTADDLKMHLFSKAPIAFAYLIVFNGKTAGFIIYSWKWATFTGKKEMYMQAIYTKPKYRRLGLAKSALSDLATVALKSGCSRIEWLAMTNNAVANLFYLSIGCTELKHLSAWRLSGDELHTLSTEKMSCEDGCY